MTSIGRLPLNDPSLRKIAGRHGLVLLIISPPRASSTAFARVLWASSAIAYYAHEPYEATYFRNANGASPRATLASPLSLARITGPKSGQGLLIKEISFQAGESFPELAGLVTAPVLFLVRDPRLTVWSRRNVRRRQGSSPDFPLAETGWEALASQLKYCCEHDLDYCLVDATDFRAQPQKVLSAACARLGIPFESGQLNWASLPGLCLSNHRTSGPDHFFTRVLSSRGVEPPDEMVPGLGEFPAGELRDHLGWALGLYHDLLHDCHRIQ
jgi:sulfotransferase family protein